MIILSVRVPVVVSETALVSTGVDVRTLVYTVVTVMDALPVLGWECSDDVSEEGGPCETVSSCISSVDWAT